ncbi:MAG: hypothetical protein FD146_1901 [Anaerolineaceae bacterium]|nr:MAG: hypothetical protein FD146_1901 [Anaerolineaceae bacterium]
MKRRRHSCTLWLLIALLLLALAAIVVGEYAPVLAEQDYGPPSPALSGWQRFSYSVRLLWNAGDLTSAPSPYAPEQVFVIAPGESVVSISTRLEETGIIRDAATFRIYLVWTGLDTSVQAGTYRLRSGQTGIEIARALQDPAPADAVLVVLPGWRMEEIAAALGTSGLDIAPADFLAAASAPASAPDFLPPGATAEGFLYPDRYTLPRTTTAGQLVSVLLSSFSLHLTNDLRDGFALHNLTVYEAVTLASIIEREAVADEEMPIIASVFYNRLAIGMKLESDPTVQYALGYNYDQGTWWTNPLSWNDLLFNSPFNTYVYGGLPPAPIASPSLAALQAVAYPAQTPYYFFMARCDGSGLHNFAESFEQHKQNLCP